MLARRLSRNIPVKRLSTSNLTFLPSSRQLWRPFSSRTFKLNLSRLARNMSSTTTPIPSHELHPLPTFQVPAGWSADPEYLDDAPECFPKTDYGIDAGSSVRAIVYDLGPKAIYLIECPQGQATYYIWNEVSDGVWKVVAPTRLEDIIPLLGDKDLKGMELHEMETVGPKVQMGEPVRG